MGANELCGVLALQGGYARHRHSLDICGVPSIEVRSPEDLVRCTRLILPGGESTTMYRLLFQAGLWQPLQQRIREGMPTFGTCAGMILLAQEIVNTQDNTQDEVAQPCLGAIEIGVSRNAYGRQIASFSAEIELEACPQNALVHFARGLSKQMPLHISKQISLQIPLIFIRAPQVLRWSKKVQVLLRYGEQAICLQQHKVLVCSFHPELSETTLLHRYFLNL